MYNSCEGNFAKIERLLFKFLWNEKNEKIKRKHLMQNYENGGIRMVNIKTQLQTYRIKWVNRLILDNDMNWKIIPTFHFDKYGKHFALFTPFLQYGSCSAAD